MFCGAKDGEGRHDWEEIDGIRIGEGPQLASEIRGDFCAVQDEFGRGDPTHTRRLADAEKKQKMDRIDL